MPEPSWMHNNTLEPNAKFSSLSLSLCASSNTRNECKTAAESAIFRFRYDFLHTQMKLDIVACENDDDDDGCPTILCNHREFCQRISVSIVFYNFAFARTFICFPTQKTLAHHKRCPSHAAQAQHNAQITILSYYYPMAHLLRITYEMKIFTV